MDSPTDMFVGVWIPFFDQATLYSSRQFKTAWFTSEEEAAHAKSTVVLTG